MLGYFRRRRDLADHTFQLKRRDVLVGDEDRVAALVDGFATIRNVEHRWSTVGLYDVVDRHIAACWLLALDQPAFDAIWAVLAGPHVRSVDPHRPSRNDPLEDDPGRNAIAGNYHGTVLS